ncbi:geranylgeranyl pyrophosphate synthetase [Diplodia corticola]|uniref:Geranylgeranyl pyrophosphate synthetase n=1 Tax=Diplodia corticola TaxID=236234 RepID=A0A1J9QTF0_9PEZI|nr:geranylgeranyl pyrophosphate synthetase [Diplodia corticola]OJD31712.1 geranylgeranyl pyrophosphate synthetase [Diplodia corticola]
MEYRRGTWRGRNRGRGRGSWRSDGFSKAATCQQPRTPSPPVGEVLKEVRMKDLVASPAKESNVPVISNCEFLGSYNWMGSIERPAMLIPGGPPRWTPREAPTQLVEDSGVFYRDENAVRQPEHPMEPAVRAFAAHNMAARAQDVDIFACGSTLGNLVRFVRKVDRPFRFTVEAVGDTVFFVRKEKSPSETIEGVRGYGHSFPEAYTTWDESCAGSKSHQRLIGYDFAGLNCVVRFEGDGYLKHLDPDPRSGAATVGTAPSTTKLDMRYGGYMVSQDAVFDLKTRSVKRMDHDVLGEEIPRLWVAQIANFVLAYHNRGVFEEIRVQNVRRDVDKWESENEETLGQLAKLIREIATMAKSRTDGRLEVCRKAVDVLEIREQCAGTPGALPDDLKAWWTDDRNNHEDESSDDDDDDDDDVEDRYFSANSDLGDGGVLLGSDDESEPDYTACSAEDCGYCGHCRY